MTPRTRTAHRPKFKVGQVVAYPGSNHLTRVVKNLPIGKGVYSGIRSILVECVRKDATWARIEMFESDVRKLTKRERGV
jgi:hypothetical protein